MPLFALTKNAFLRQRKMRYKSVMTRYYTVFAFFEGLGARPGDEVVAGALCRGVVRLGIRAAWSGLCGGKQGRLSPRQYHVVYFIVSVYN